MERRRLLACSALAMLVVIAGGFLLSTPCRECSSCVVMIRFWTHAVELTRGFSSPIENLHQEQQPTFQPRSHHSPPPLPELLQPSPSSRKLKPGRRFLYGSISCSNKDITITQGRAGTTSRGMPQYVVQIVNTCMSDCSPSNIHLHCGWFASAPLVNPMSFKRINYDDCLVAGGRPLKQGEIIRFQYANLFQYPLSFKSAQFC